MVYQSMLDMFVPDSDLVFRDVGTDIYCDPQS